MKEYIDYYELYMDGKMPLVEAFAKAFNQCALDSVDSSVSEAAEIRDWMEEEVCDAYCELLKEGKEDLPKLKPQTVSQAIDAVKENAEDELEKIAELRKEMSTLYMGMHGYVHEEPENLDSVYVHKIQ